MKYVIHKLTSFLFTLLLISAITFFSLHILPGDPAVLILGTEGDPMQLDILREQLGVNQHPVLRYCKWLFHMIKGDLGVSVRYGVDVASLVLDALPMTLLLAVMAVGLALAISVPLGVSCAVKQGTLLESAGLIITELGMAIPAFWLGILLINLFSLKLNWLPPTGYTSIISLVMPAFALAVPRAAILTRVVRSNMLEAFQKDYIRTARSKGLPQKTILYKHALKNASINVCSVAGIHLTQLLGGTIVIEQVFSLPGVGQLLLNAVLQRDLPLVQGVVVIAACFILLSNLIFDLILAVLDPRIRFE